MPQFDEVEVRKALSIFIEPEDLFEIRIFGKRKTDTISGYFKDVGRFIDELKKQNLNDVSVYFVLNKIKPECYGREQADQLIKTQVATQDSDIKRRDWILIDLDPKRPSGTSATKEQVEKSYQKATKVYKHLKSEGFPDPVIGFSGNGYHLVYKIALRNEDQNRELIKQFLNALAILFDDDDVEIDQSVFNAARVCKLYGTYATKGRSTETQPHRKSYIRFVPQEIIPVDKKYIENIIREVKIEKVQPTRYNNYNAESFVLDDWLNKYNLGYRKVSVGGIEKYLLECCPFDSNHTGKDAAIFKLPNGAIGFKCFHNSCREKTWKDVRKLFEPDAYSKKWDKQEQRMFRSNKQETAPIQPIVEKENEPIFLTSRQIFEKPTIEQRFVKTGIKELDRKMRGLMKGHTSVWSGLRASAKSTVLSQIALNAVDSGCTVIVYSGELTDKGFMRWMNQQAAGHHTEPSQYEGYYNTPRKIQEKIADWLGDKFYLYNNSYGNNFEQVIEKVEEQATKTKADLVILDNLMAFNISSLGNTKWDAQTAFVWKLHELSEKCNIHIAFVAHPRKAQGFLRFNDISGTADLGNAVDDAFIIHRNNEDFRRLSAEMFHWKESDDVYQGTNVIEIVKDREGGTQDVFIPLYYEVQSKRLKNSPGENVVYGWEDSVQDDFLPITDEDNPFT